MESQDLFFSSGTYEGARGRSGTLGLLTALPNENDSHLAKE